jgi:hypothetical protein
MKAIKSARTLAASLGVLAVGALAATPAQAFDNVNWTWNKTLTSTEKHYVTISLDVDTTGMVEVEKLQIFLGTLNATSTVSYIDNDPDYGGEYKYYWSCGCQIAYWDKGTLNAITELPEVNSDAVAIANLQSITSDVPVYLHDGQFVANDASATYAANYDKFADLLTKAGCVNCGADSGNLHTDLAKAFLYGAVYDVLDPATISVDSTATAIGNITQVTLESDVNNVDTNCTDKCDPYSNHIVIADLTQFAYANISATSTVSNVEVDSYTNMRKITNADGDVVPWVNSVATAIGNAVVINVGKVTP